MRTASIERKTKETNIAVEVNLDGTGKYNIQTGIGKKPKLNKTFAQRVSSASLTSSRPTIESRRWLIRIFFISVKLV